MILVKMPIGDNGQTIDAYQVKNGELAGFGGGADQPAREDKPAKSYQYKFIKVPVPGQEYDLVLMNNQTRERFFVESGVKEENMAALLKTYSVLYVSKQMAAQEAFQTAKADADKAKADADKAKAEADELARAKNSQSAFDDEVVAPASSSLAQDTSTATTTGSATRTTITRTTGTDTNPAPGRTAPPSFTPGDYLTQPLALGLATSGSTIAMSYAQPLVKGLMGNFAGKMVSGLLLAPLAGAIAGAALTNLALRAQYYAEYGTAPDAESKMKINKKSWDNAGLLGGAFFGVGVAVRGIEKAIDEIAGDDWLTKTLGADLFDGVAGLGSVEFKGAAMVITGLGLGLGLMGAMIAQNIYKGEKHDPKAYAAAFFVGFAIGAAAMIGYGNEIASYLMPLATTTGLLMLMPVVKNPIDHAKSGVEKLTFAGNWMKEKINMTNRNPGHDVVVDRPANGAGAGVGPNV